MKQTLFICLNILIICTFSYCQAPRKPPPELDPVHLGGPAPLDIVIDHYMTADQQIRPDTNYFQFGINPGWYGNGYSDQQLNKIARDAGIHSTRPSISDNFVFNNGYDIRVNAFRYYRDSLKFRDIVVFLNEPRPEWRDTAYYSKYQSKTFAHLYNPIWNPDSTVNENNYYADYVYNVVRRYGPDVTFWEVWNEPDVNNAPNGYNLPGQSGNWYDNPPPVGYLYGFYAPVYDYNRMLRITYSIVHRLFPDEYVCTGGIGYPGFLDAILRYTDNPDSGKVSAKYPLRGGAYFDVLSYHDYPMYHLHHWDNSIGGFRFNRTSDSAAADGIQLKNEFQDVLNSYGYDGTRFPKKLFINTEINISRKRFGDQIGSEESQRNFMLKFLVKAQQNGVLQVYIFALGENEDFDKAKDPFGLMGLYENLQRDSYGSQKMTGEGIAVKTMSALTFGYRYDAALTGALHLPQDVDGAAFTRNGRQVYVLWARQLTDLNESSQAVYHFPAALGLHSLKEFDWDYSLHPDQGKPVNPGDIHLGGTPVFLTQ